MAVDKEFAARLAQACDALPGLIPPYGQGRLVVLAKHLNVSLEAVRRWFNGVARPRARTMNHLAKLLNTNEAWLSLGVKTDMRPIEKTLFLRSIEGARHLALGLAKCEHFICATPDEGDPRKDVVDFYVSRDGKLSAIHAVLAKELKPGQYVFTVPRQYEQLKNVGFIVDPKRGFANMHVLELQHHLITKHKESEHSDAYSVTVKVKDHKFVSGRDEWRVVSTFGELV